MNTVALINQKGGVGKSTVASYLGVQAHLEGFATAVVDTDRSASLAKWMRTRAKLSGKPGPTLLVANDENDPGKLLAAVEKARDAGVEWLFIDTAAGIHPLHSVAASVADVVLIPTTPSIRDQQVTADTVRLVLDEKKPGFLFISKGSQSKSKNDRVALGLSTAFKIPSLSTHIVLRTPTQDADLRGETLFDLDSKESSVVAGKEEFRALWQWLREHFGEQVGELVETAHAEE